MDELFDTTKLELEAACAALNWVEGIPAIPRFLGAIAWVFMVTSRQEAKAPSLFKNDSRYGSMSPHIQDQQRRGGLTEIQAELNCQTRFEQLSKVPWLLWKPLEIPSRILALCRWISHGTGVRYETVTARLNSSDGFAHRIEIQIDMLAIGSVSRTREDLLQQLEEISKATKECQSLINGLLDKLGKLETDSNSLLVSFENAQGKCTIPC